MASYGLCEGAFPFILGPHALEISTKYAFESFFHIALHMSITEAQKNVWEFCLRGFFFECI